VNRSTLKVTLVPTQLTSQRVTSRVAIVAADNAEGHHHRTIVVYSATDWE
jgi:hypothetical protein